MGGFDMNELQPLIEDVLAEQRRVVTNLDVSAVRANLTDAIAARRRQSQGMWLMVAAAAIALTIVGYRQLRPSATAPTVVADEATAPAPKPPSTVASEASSVPTEPHEATTAAPAPEQERQRERVPTPPQPRVPSWSELLEGGQTDEALRQVSTGFDSATAGASANELLRLAEVAMVAKRPAIARSALGALRARHPKSNQAAIASFYLGKLAMKSGRERDAGAAFQAYLQAQPQGPLAREALGRLIEARQAAGEQTKARQTARDYLKRHPRGPHAPLARRLLDDGR
jgi:TolA-binding protein